MSIFTKFISGESPELVLLEDETFIAVLESSPLVLGHVVVIPKNEEDHFFDLSDSELSEIMVFAKPVAKAIKAAVTCEKVGVAVLGLVARHAHVHLVPITTADDMNFTRPKLSPSPEVLAALANRIRQHLSNHPNL